MLRPAGSEMWTRTWTAPALIKTSSLRPLKWSIPYVGLRTRMDGPLQRAQTTSPALCRDDRRQSVFGRPPSDAPNKPSAPNRPLSGGDERQLDRQHHWPQGEQVTDRPGSVRPAGRELSREVGVHGLEILVAGLHPEAHHPFDYFGPAIRGPAVSSDHADGMTVGADLLDRVPARTGRKTGPCRDHGRRRDGGSRRRRPRGRGRRRRGTLDDDWRCGGRCGNRRRRRRSRGRCYDRLRRRGGGRRHGRHRGLRRGGRGRPSGGTGRGDQHRSTGT